MYETNSKNLIKCNFPSNIGEHRCIIITKDLTLRYATSSEHRTVSGLTPVNNVVNLYFWPAAVYDIYKSATAERIYSVSKAKQVLLGGDSFE